MPPARGIKQKIFARKRKTKAQEQNDERKKKAEERKITATMNTFLGRSQVIPTLPTIDVDATWDRIRERDEEHVLRGIVMDDDSYNSSDNEESESDEDYEFETFDDVEAK